MSIKLKKLTNKDFHDIIKTNNKEFIIEYSNESELYDKYREVGNEVKSWFKDYDVAFTSIGGRGLAIYNLQGLVWLYNVIIVEKKIDVIEKNKNNITHFWSDFFSKWS